MTSNLIFPQEDFIKFVLVSGACDGNINAVPGQGRHSRERLDNEKRVVVDGNISTSIYFNGDVRETNMKTVGVRYYNSATATWSFYSADGDKRRRPVKK